MNMIRESDRILIVDDEKTNVDVLVGLFADSYKTIVAKSGVQALKRAASNPPPDLILLDIMMPDIHGLEVCRQLKSNKETNSIPIIFITGMNAPHDEATGLKAGAVDYISKPFNPDVVMARVQTHLELQKQRAHLKELNEIKNKFLGMAAHDLRNPLGSIQGLSDMLLTMDLKDDEKIKFITTIHKVSNQMLNLLNDLLDVSVIESSKFELKIAEEDLTELAVARIELMKFYADKKGIEVNTEMQPLLRLLCDRERLAQVIDNLISNAIKFSFSGSSITIRTGFREGKVYFQVADQGPGIPEEEKSRLFGAFQRLSVKPTGDEKSTGLGLSIVKKIVDAHNGEIRVESHCGQGSIFTVIFRNGGANIN